MKKEDIFKRQNEVKFIEMLAAQRVIYSQGKKINKYVFWGNLIIPILFFLITSFYLGNNISKNIVLFIGGILATITLVSRFLVKNKKKKAALIQEKLDNDLLGITPNPKHQGQKITLGEIEKAAIRYEKPTKELHNWYYDNGKKDFKSASLDCQMQNMGWEGKQRWQYTLFVCTLGFIFIAILTYIQQKYFYVEKIWLLFVPFAGLIFYFVCMVLQGLWKAWRLKKKYYEAKLKKLQFDRVPEKKSDEEWKIFQRELQDFIYQNRKSTALIPDWFYSLFKRKIHPKVYRYDSKVGEILIETGEYAIFSKPKIEDGIQSFEKAFASVNHFSQSVIKEMEISNAKEITLEMGLKVTGGLEFAIAKAQKEGQVKVTVRWTKPEKG